MGRCKICGCDLGPCQWIHNSPSCFVEEDDEEDVSLDDSEVAAEELGE